MTDACLTVLGSINLDHVIRLPRFPAPGETLSGEDYLQVPGGKGANQAIAAVRMRQGQLPVNFIACLGQEAAGQALLDYFRAEGLNTDGISSVSQATGVALIYVNQQGENCIALHPGANQSLTAERVRQQQARLLASQLLLMQLESPIEALIEAARIVKSAGGKVMLNPAPAPAGALDPALLALVDILTPNQHEASQLTGIAVTDAASAAEAAAHLHQAGVEQVIITLGSQGLYASSRDTSQGQHYPAFVVEPLDTTAAGDTFNGALAIALVEGNSLPEALPLAQAAAAISVTRAGAQTSIPRRAEVERQAQAHAWW
ncbi:ribokinase [Balneatrix alpica]|uniref:Ribokinase n=1 Tax=Balneatrix alpica TaxID=75684 RepID=A0ABV5ZFI2_9GAMM|nr:ribokinase [Balneatrix alpica]